MTIRVYLLIQDTAFLRKVCMHSVLVIGASGFVGRNLVHALVTKGHAVRGVARDVSRVSQLGALGAEIVRGDVVDAASMKHACAGVDAVYVSIHTISPQPADTADNGFMDIESAGIRNIIDACRTNGVRRMVYLTSLGITPDSRSVWLRERWMTEQLLLTSGLDATILRPGQIAGVGGMGFDTW